MSGTLLQALLTNAATATLLAAAVALATRWIRRPGVAHALWLLVLLELLAPPVIPLAALPSPAPVARVALRPLEPIAGLATAAPAAAATSSRAAAESLFTAGNLLVGLWLLGAGGLLLLAVRRSVRFERALVPGEPPAELRETVSRIARELGLASPPPVRLAPGRLPPMLWCRPGRRELLLPAELLPRLAREERDSLIAHELCHLKRRDPWIRWIETVAAALFWWHPLVFWVRRKLRVAEEKSCDQLVLQRYPRRARPYAEGLLKTIEFLAGQPATPALATGAGEPRALEERLTMILHHRPTRGLAPALRILLLVVAAVALFVFPTWADRPAAQDHVDHADRADRADRHEEMLRLEQEQAELLRALRHLEARRIDLERSLGEERRQRELARVDAEIASLEQRGRTEEAAELARRAARERELKAMEEQIARTERDHLAGSAELEFALQQGKVELERARREGDARRVAELEQRNLDLARELEILDLDSDRAHRRLAEEQVKIELARAAEDRDRLAAQGRAEEAERLALEMAQRKHEIAAMRREERLARQEAAFREQIRKLHKEGRDDEARELELELDRQHHLSALKQLEAQAALYRAELRQAEDDPEVNRLALDALRAELAAIEAKLRELQLR